MYLIILISDWPKFPISLQASSGGACRSLAALISLPRFSASSRKGMNPFMQSSEGPACEGGAGPRSNAEPVIGAAPCAGNELGAATEAAGAGPFHEGEGGTLVRAALQGSG